MTGPASLPTIGVGASATRGWAGVAHIPAIQSLDAFEIRAVSTTRIESARETADRIGIDLAFDSHLPLVTHPRVDLVVVAVKVPEHHRIVSDALARWSIANGRSPETCRKHRKWRRSPVNGR